MPVSASPDWEFQTACVALLKSSPDLASLIGNEDGTLRLYQDVPGQNPVFPYVTLGECQNVPDRAECIEGAICLADFHVWSTKSSFQECKNIAQTMLDIIAASVDALAMTNHRAVDCYSDGVRTVRDPDGTTRHAILTMKALTEPL